MKKLSLFIAVVLVLLLWIATVSGVVTIPPPEPLRLYCNGETNEYNTFWVNPNSDVILTANTNGNWTDSGVKYQNILRATISNKDQQFIFTADDGRRATVFVRVVQRSHCLPKFDDDYPIIINNERKKIKTIQAVVGEVFTIRAHYHQDKCSDYNFYWTIKNNNGAIEISNPNASETTMRVLKLPGGPNPEIYAVLSNDYLWPHEEYITVQISQPEPPVCELDVNYSPSNWLSRSTIKISFAGSHPASDGDTIEKYIAKLYYYNSKGQWQYIGENDYDSREKTISASMGEGMYKIVGYVEDNHGQQSKAVEKTIYIPGTRYDTPTIYAPKIISCKVNETCFIHTDTHNKDYPTEFFYGDIKLGNGPNCAFFVKQAGTYNIIVKTHRFGCDDCKDYSTVITVRATQNITRSLPPAEMPSEMTEEQGTMQTPKTPSFSSLKEWLRWLYSG